MTPRWLETTEAALNAVLGDYLETRSSPLATGMAFYHCGTPLALAAESFQDAKTSLSSRIAILVHGMAQTEACWSFTADVTTSYGSLLRDEFGFSPFFLRYNTGRRVAHNGRDLALLLEKLVEALPIAVDDITLIGHSMGGLLIRSACHYADELGLAWIHKARRAFYLGTPHLGSPLEKGGLLVSNALGAINHPVVRLIHDVANLRSAGVKDLGHGRLLGDGGDDEPRSVPLRAQMDHYLVAGTLAKREDHFISRVLGDSLVRVPSAVDPGRRAGLPEGNMAILPGVHHMMLAHCPDVYLRIRDWLGIRLEPVTTPSPSPLPDRASGKDVGRTRVLERIDAYRALVQDGIDHGATAIQEVQEELTARPYEIVEWFWPLKVPAGIVRSFHMAAIRTTYDAIRWMNRLVDNSVSRT
jgi:triacylglycerol lipase